MIKDLNGKKLGSGVYFAKPSPSENVEPIKMILLKKLKKIDFISRGDDYQILFTASKKKARIIKKTFKFLGIKISKIGKICSSNQKSQIIDEKGNKTTIKNKGYIHKF